ncbi:GAF domain-containing sensor histidine kinase [Cryptosporangium japonicum]|uniref:histidine kinase n=1 Tax=Cryptosporangium japonicum TaxID=80872 RepID=A0ABN0TGW7_9ACTN
MWRLLRIVVAALAVIGAAGFVAGVGPAFRRLADLDPALVARPEAVRAGLDELGVSRTVFAGVTVTVLVLVAAAFFGVGVLVLARRPHDRAAVLTAGVLVVFGVVWPDTVPVPGWPAAVTVTFVVIQHLGFVGFLGLPYCFPDGRFVPRWTGPVFAVVAVYVVGADTLLAAGVRLPGVLDLVVVVGWFGVGAWSQLRRYRRVSTPVQRQQTKWVAAAMVTAAVGFTLVAFANTYVPRSPVGAVVLAGFELAVFGGVFALVPAAIARAVLRYRLWDIDPILNRALVLGGLTLALGTVYAVVVTVVSRAVAVDAPPLASFAAAGAVAVLVEPLRRPLQRLANRLTYGDRDEPHAAVRALTRRLQDTDAVLPTLVRSIREAVRTRYAAVEDAGGGLLAASGDRPDEPLRRRPLHQHGEVLGALVLAARGPGEEFDSRDERLVDDLARQAATALLAVRLQTRAVRLADELQASRERLVTAREEERRQLRRELHDGLGPTLAAQAMRIEAARNLVGARPEAATALLDEVLADCAEAVAEVRRVSRALRPPALDELGLAEAIRQAAARPDDRLLVSVDIDPLPPLPAAVEVAAYAIAREALTNVGRHAAARSATIRAAVTGAVLRLEVIDDGRGRPDVVVPGVGTETMRERARELGGECLITDGPGGGTVVTATIPLGGRHGRADR